MKRSRLSLCSPSAPISIKKHPRTPEIEFSQDFDNDNDDVFASQKENIYQHKKRLIVNEGKLTVASATPSRTLLFPSLTGESGICVNSPGRKVLLEASSLASMNIKVLGRGSFGSVILGSWRGKRVAVKILNKRPSSSSSESSARTDSVTSELNAQDLIHDNVVRIYGVYPDPNMNSVIIMEYAGKSNLQSLLDTHPEKIDQQFTHRCLENLSSALEYIHCKEVLHLDVKPSNIFVSSSGICKLGDFGCSRKVSSRKASSENQILVGTSGYQAPEYLREKKPTEKCDVYSFGITMWQILTKEYPFKNCHPHTVIFLVVAQHKRPDEKHESSNQEFRNLYKKCWDENPDRRPSMKSVHETLKRIVGKRRKSSSLRI